MFSMGIKVQLKFKALNFEIFLGVDMHKIYMKRIVGKELELEELQSTIGNTIFNALYDRALNLDS